MLYGFFKLWQCKLFEMIEKPLDERGTVFSDELLWLYVRDMVDIWLNRTWHVDICWQYGMNTGTKSKRSHMIHSNSVIFSNKISRSWPTKMPSQSKTNYSRRICFFESFRDNYGQLWLMNGRIYSCLRAGWPKDEPNTGRKMYF